jgi:protein arginine kinase activator
MPMKCQKCTKAATLHITEILGEERIEELHLCEECAHKYLNDSQEAKLSGDKPALPASAALEESGALNRTCSICGIKFIEFRNSGRLGCPHDYQEFHDELVPLLENVHGETKHCGKVPRRLPENKRAESELVQLRKQLSHAVNSEAYEEAARLRDKIKQIEAS